MSNVRRDDTTELVMNEPNFDKSHYNNLIKASDDFRYSKRLLPLLQHSKFATLEDLKKHNGKLSDLMKNPNLSVDEHKKIAHALVNDKDLIENRENITVPEHISQHLSDEDHEKLSKTNGNLTFESPKHSHKHIKDIHKNIVDADDTISEHISDKEDEDSDYEPAYDSVHNDLKKVLKKHIVKYARAIDDHLDAHGDNPDEVDKAESHLNKVNSLDNYDPAHDDSNHYDEHIQDVQNKIDRKR